MRGLSSGWIALAVATLGGFVLLAFLATAWPAFGVLDSWLSAAIRATRNPIGNNIADWFTFVGSGTFVAPATAVLMIWMAIRRNWAATVYIFMTIAVGWFLGEYLLKPIIHRPRPVGVNIAPITTDFSMPSGHSLASFLLFATFCVIVMLNMPTGRHVKRWIAAGAALVIILVGCSRVYLGVHYAGDVLSAWLLGGAWWSFTTATYFGSVTEEERRLARKQVAQRVQERSAS
jgi:undecaprenyl-diphosphatase